MAGTSFRNKSAFAFLQDVRKKFRERYSDEEILKARDYDMSAGFSEIYKNLIVTVCFIYRIHTTVPRTKTTKIYS